MILDDTIAAISTAIGEGGIGIVRMTGDKSLEVLKRVFQSAKGKETAEMKSYTMRYGYIVDPKSGEAVDEAIVSYMKAPNTYTREDVVEVNCHGGIVAVKKILKILLENGARLAEPGEFTKRAFLNGRIDLSQAEAIVDLIRSKTDESMKLALDQAQGKLSERIKKLMHMLLGALAHIEAAVAFPEEDVDDVASKSVINLAKNVIVEIDELIVTSDTGKILREGLNTIIVGKPNVGKSSLLNALLQETRAIVTDVPGTTRDVIEEYLNIKGVPVKLVDTAGIRSTHDVVEAIGVEKSKEYIEKSDLIIFMVDASRDLSQEDNEIIEIIRSKKCIIVVNKVDLPIMLDLEYIKKIFGENSIVYSSVNTEKGVDDIKNKIVDMVYEGKVAAKEVYVTNIRHRDILIKAKHSLSEGISTLEAGTPIDFASIEFKEAYLKLGEITGDTVAEDIIDRIFADFCLGK
jgi:tRNA modification GTPase